MAKMTEERDGGGRGRMITVKLDCERRYSDLWWGNHSALWLAVLAAVMPNVFTMSCPLWLMALSGHIEASYYSAIWWMKRLKTGGSLLRALWNIVVVTWQ